jgi:hypothetical protein
MFVLPPIVSRTGHVVRVVVGLVLAVATLAAAQPVPPARLSVATDGTPGNGPSGFIAMSPDGRSVLFYSAASNLVAGDTNNQNDLFVRDRDTDRDGVLDEPGAVRTIRISQGPAGEQAPIPVDGGAQISKDGRFVLFSTQAALVAADTNGHVDGYLYDRDADQNGIFDEPGSSGLTLVTTGNGNVLALGGDSAAIGISTDGRYVLFSSGATNLTAQPATVSQIYRKDRVTSLTVLVSSGPDGSPADRGVSGVMSADGRRVLLAGGFSGLMPNGIVTTGTFPWVLREPDTNGFVPIAVPATLPSLLPAAPPSSGPPVAAPAVVTSSFAYGLSADGSRAYIGVQTLICCLVAATSGTTFEYDVAANRMTRLLPGFPPDTLLDTRDPASFPIITSRGNVATPFTVTVAEISRYDLATRRLTTLVPRYACPSFATAGHRTLYRGPDCAGPVLLLDERYGVPLPMPAPVDVGTLDAAGSMVVFNSAVATLLPGGADTNGVQDVFAVDLLSRFDRDDDGLDDRWEAAMGLDYTSSTGNDGPTGDPDADGLTNLQEQAAGSHPRGAARQFLAEGADNAFFKTRLAIANPGTTAATAVVRLDGDDGSSTSINVHVPAGARRTVFVDEIAGRASSFSSTVESSVPLVGERTMSWDATEYGAHAERASNAPSTQWVLAEGATGAFSLFYLLQNPGNVAATATIRYLRPAPLAPIDRNYTLPPHSRTTLPVEQQAPELASTDVSAAITSTQPILVERAMYRSVPGQPFAAGDDSAGVTAPSTTWFLAEGATGPFFDLFVLLANPGGTDADVEIRYLLPDGTVLTKTYPVAAQSRRTIYVDQETIAGHGQPFVNVAVSCAITSTVPIVAERTMWFPGPEVTPNFWTEANNSPGATATARRWVLADGEAGGSKATQTYVLIANTSSTPGRVRLTVLPDFATAPIDPSSDQLQPVTKTLDLAPNSRTTVAMDTIVAGRRFGVLVEAIDTTPLADLVVERAMYWNSGGVTWAAGTNLLATPIP